MIYQSFDSQFGPLVASFSWALVIGLVSYGLVFKTRLFAHLLTSPLVPPFLALPAILFAFLMGFMSSESWQNVSHARTALINESAAISRLMNVPIQPPDYQLRADALLESYLETSLEDEWKGSHNEFSSPRVDTLINQLELNIWAAHQLCEPHRQPDTCTGSIETTALIKAVDDLRNAREQRLSFGYEDGVNYRWILVILLALVSAVSIAAVHAQNRKTAAIALVLYCLSLWFALGMVTLHINPYKWQKTTHPTPLIKTLDSLKQSPKLSHFSTNPPVTDVA